MDVLQRAAEVLRTTYEGWKLFLENEVNEYLNGS